MEKEDFLIDNLSSESDYQTSGSRDFEFLIHKSCADYPQEIQHYFHSCTLFLSLISSFTCAICHKKCFGFTYQCGKCSFNMDIECAQLSITISESEEEEIRYFSHQHPLKTVLSEMEDLEATCEACGKLCLTPCYGCCKCNFYIHKSCVNVLPQKTQVAFHSCPLLLLTSPLCWCVYCGENFSGLVYCCNGNCRYELCVSCFQMCKKKCYGLARVIQHFFHPCLLVLNISKYYICNSCYESQSGFAYCCEQCHFYMDIGCAQSATANFEGKEEGTRHFCHRHILTVLSERDYFQYRCEICGKLCASPFYGCSQCEFHIHKSCMELLTQKVDCSFHSCTLVLLTSPLYWCVSCGENLTGLAFACGKCRYELCVSCFLVYIKKCDGLTREVQHFFHPCLLTLNIYKGEYTCNSCHHQRHSGLTYSCEQCHFYMDVQCTQYHAVEAEGEELHIEHFCHQHSMIIKTEEVKALCHICGNFCTGTTYVCYKCNFYLHKCCMEILPHKIQHLSHDCPLPLMLLTNPCYNCTACGKHSGCLTFSCDNCGFNLCVKCSLLPTESDGRNKKILHFSHEHPLTLNEKKQQIDQKVCCNACKKHISDLAYGCKKCNFFLDKSCAGLPQEIHSHIHPFDHPLSLKSKQVFCKLCFMSCDIAYCCELCDFHLDIACVYLKPTVKYDGHVHLLTVVENMYLERTCDACDALCPAGSSTLRCWECDFNLHLTCGPLPCTIKHKCHIDQLTLKDFYVDYNDDDDDEFYCDACEQRRDPRLCVYYCSLGCPMIVDVKCVISEVIASLMGERGDVELRLVNDFIRKKFAAKAMENNDLAEREEQVEFKFLQSWKEIFHSLTENEILEIKDVEASIPRELNRKEPSPRYKKRYITSSSIYTEKAFTEFMHSLQSCCIRIWQPRHYLDRERDLVADSMLLRLNSDIVDLMVGVDDFVAVGDYFIPQIYIPIFEKMEAKYGDIGAHSTLSPKVKSLVLNIVCSVILDLRGTKVVDISEDELCLWWRCINWVKLAGFDVNFICDHLTRVARAHFGLQARKFMNDTRVKQDKGIERLSRKILQLTEESRATKLKLEVIKKRQEDHQVYVKHTTMLIKPFLDEASEMKWKPAADGLL